jgi:hypothetical protein
MPEEENDAVQSPRALGSVAAKVTSVRRRINRLRYSGKRENAKQNGNQQSDSSSIRGLHTYSYTFPAYCD